MNILLRRETVERVSLRFFHWMLHARGLFIFLTVLQLLWLGAIGWSGANTNWSKLVPLAIYFSSVGLVVFFLPNEAANPIQSFRRMLLQKERTFFLFLALVVLVVGIFYAPGQRVWADENHILQAGKIIAAEGFDGLRTSYMKIPWLGYQHPPLFALVHGLLVSIFGPSLTVLRFLTMIFLLGTLWVTYLLGRDLYDREIAFVGTLLLLSFPLIFRLGTTAMMDIPLTFFFSLSLLLTVRLTRRPSYRWALATGVVIGLGLLTKYVMVLFYGVLLFYFIFSRVFRSVKKYAAVAVLVSVSIASVWVLYAFQLGLIDRQIQRIIEYSGIHYVIQGVGTSEDGRNSPQEPTVSIEAEGRIEASENRENVIPIRIYQLGLESVLTRIPSSLGVQHVPIIFLGGLLLLHRRTPSDRFILLWIGFVSIALLITLPDHRYFLPTFPAIALMTANYLKRNPENSQRVLIMALLFWVGSLYLFYDWNRESHLFLPDS